MQTVGQVLKNARLKKGVSLAQVEKATKIKEYLLEALENGEYQKLPPSTFIKGFIRNYGGFLGLSVNRLLALFRREYNLSSSQKLLVDESGKFLSPSIWDIVQNKLFPIGAVLLLLLFLIFLGRGFLVPPRLVLNSPVENLITPELSVEVSGQTEPGARLTINDQAVTLKKDGKFAVRVQLTIGDNIISVVSTNKLSRPRKITRTVTVSP